MVTRIFEQSHKANQVMEGLINVPVGKVPMGCYCVFGSVLVWGFLLVCFVVWDFFFFNATGRDQNL
jgi:hypothetical protein